MLTMSPSGLRLQMRHDPVGDVHQPEDVGLEHRPHGGDVERANLGAIGVAGVVDEHVDAAHQRERLVHRPLVVVAAGHIRDDAVSAGCRRQRVDARAVAAREGRPGAGRPRLLHQRRADALTSACDQQPSLCHDGIIDPAGRPRVSDSNGRREELPEPGRAFDRSGQHGVPDVVDRRQAALARSRPTRTGSRPASRETAPPATCGRCRRARSRRGSDRSSTPLRPAGGSAASD